MKKYRKVMGLAIVLVALAVAINALAFNTASVTSSATFTISGTGSAALGIDTHGTPGTGFTVGGTSNSYATIAIADQMQPNSTYTFTNVFLIENNNPGGSGRNINLSAISFSPALPAGLTVTLYKSGTGDLIGTGSAVSVAAGASMSVDMTVSIGSAVAVGAQNLGIVINGTEN